MGNMQTALSRMSHLGHSRRFDRGPAPSGLPRSTDIVRPPRHIGLVPNGRRQSRSGAARGPIRDTSAQPHPARRVCKIGRYGHMAGHALHFHVIPVCSSVKRCFFGDPRHRNLRTFDQPPDAGDAEDETDGADFRNPTDPTSPPPPRVAWRPWKG
jgi:hypothetical protein